MPEAVAAGHLSRDVDANVLAVARHAFRQQLSVLASMVTPDVSGTCTGRTPRFTASSCLQGHLSLEEQQGKMLDRGFQVCSKLACPCTCCTYLSYLH